MDYFRKIGRTNDDEQAVIQAIEKLIREKQIPRSEIPLCTNLDDLLEVQALLEAYVSNVQREPEHAQISEAEITVEQIPEQTGKEPEAQPESIEPETSEQTEPETEEIPELAEVVTDEQTEPEAQRVDSEEQPKAAADQPNFVADDYDPFADEIKQRSYNTQSGQKADSIKAATESGTAEPEIPELEETPVDDLNPKTKRRVAEQTAETLLKGYSRLAPKPFKWLAKIDVEKIERMHFEGEIDINLEVSEGTTFDDYVKENNEKVDEIFEVDEDTLNEIREPLIEVLLEQKLELTPQQRLGMAVVSHLFQMLSIAINLRKQNNRILEYQKRMTILASQGKAA